VALAARVVRLRIEARGSLHAGAWQDACNLRTLCRSAVQTRRRATKADCEGARRCSRRALHALFIISRGSSWSRQGRIACGQREAGCWVLSGHRPAAPRVHSRRQVSLGPMSGHDRRYWARRWSWDAVCWTGGGRAMSVRCVDCGGGGGGVV
jgi:hypothetical protein